MKGEQDYIQDIAEMRSMMERSTKFLSLSGLAGILAGGYALVGAFVAYRFFNFHPDAIFDNADTAAGLPKIILVALSVLLLAIGTALFLSSKKAKKRGEKFWNPTARRLLQHMGVPLLAGGLLLLILMAKGLTGFLAPFSLLFYGLALYNAGRFTYHEIKSLGLIQIALGLLGSLFVPYGLLCWAVGFGLFHIIYGIYVHFRYER